MQSVSQQSLSAPPPQCTCYGLAGPFCPATWSLSNVVDLTWEILRIPCPTAAGTVSYVNDTAPLQLVLPSRRIKSRLPVIYCVLDIPHLLHYSSVFPVISFACPTVASFLFQMCQVHFPPRGSDVAMLAAYKAVALGFSCPVRVSQYVSLPQGFSTSKCTVLSPLCNT